MDEQKEQLDMEQKVPEKFSEEFYADILKEVEELTAAVPEEPAITEVPELKPTEADAIIVPFQARKKRKNRFLKCLLIAVLAVLILGGGIFAYFYFFNPIEPKAERVLLPSTITLREGGSTTLKCIVQPEGASQAVIWTVSDPSVLKVNNRGEITVLAPGNCTVSATAGSGAQGRCFVKVRPALTFEEGMLIGTWTRFKVSDRGRITNTYSTEYAITFHEDRTGTFLEDGEETTFTWELDEPLDGYYYYKISLPNHRGATMSLNANTGDAMTGTLTLKLEDSLLWLYSLK